MTLQNPRPSLGLRLRRNTGALVADTFFRGVSKFGKLHPKARPERHNVELIRDVPYLGTQLDEHRLDIYRPLGRAGPLPIVVYLHGGGFRILSKDTHWVMGLAFARRGYLVFNVSYRLAPRHPFPAAIEDACHALSWVQQHAPDYGGDLGQLVLAGESAGGNLVTSLALATSYPRREPFAARVFESGVRPRAVVAACGMLQVTEPERFRRRWPDMHALVFDRIHEVSDAFLAARRYEPAELELADPLPFLERGAEPARPLPSFFIPCGTKDPLIDDSQRLERALRRLGTRCEARYYPGEMHAFHAFVWRKNARRCWQHTYEFLDRELNAVDTPAEFGLDEAV